MTPTKGVSLLQQNEMGFARDGLGCKGGRSPRSDSQRWDQCIVHGGTADVERGLTRAWGSYPSNRPKTTKNLRRVG